MMKWFHFVLRMPNFAIQAVQDSQIGIKLLQNYCHICYYIIRQISAIGRAYYDKNGIFLAEDNHYPGRVTPEVLMECLSRLYPEILAKFEAEKML